MKFKGRSPFGELVVCFLRGFFLGSVMYRHICIMTEAQWVTANRMGLTAEVTDVEEEKLMAIGGQAVTSAAYTTEAQEVEEANSSLTIGLLGLNKTVGPPFQLWLMGSALTIAFDEVNQNDAILPKHTLKFLVAYDNCHPAEGLDAMIRLVQEDKVDAIIGPSCSTSALTIAYLASSWNVPMIGYVGRNPSLTNKEEYPTYIRSISSLSHMGDVIRSICIYYGWKTVGVIGPAATSGPYDYMRDSMVQNLPTYNITINVVEYTEVTGEILQEMAQKARGKVLEKMKLFS